MLSPIDFFNEIDRRVRLKNPINKHLFMHEEKERGLQNTNYHPQSMFEISFRSYAVAIQIFVDNSVSKGNLYIQILRNSGGTTTNTQHCTLTNKNIDQNDEYFVRPSLVRCVNQQFQHSFRKINGYPKRIAGRKSCINVGPMCDEIVDRVIEVAIAKYNSIA